MKRLLPYIGIGVGALALAIVHVSIFPVFRLTQHADLILVALIFITIAVPTKYSLYTSICFGVLMDIFSYFPIGTLTTIFIICWGIMFMLQQNVLTTYSLASLILLTLSITIIFHLLLLGFSYIQLILDQIQVPIILDSQWFKYVGLGLLSNVILISMLYGMGRAFSKRFNKVFVSR